MDILILRWALGTVVLVAAAIDWKTGKIPNWLTLPAMTAGLVMNSFAGLAVGRALLGMLAALGVYFLFFVVGFRGAGDGKLMGAVGAFVGWPQVAIVMILVALLGGVAALAVAWQRGLLFPLLRSTAGLVSDIVCLRWRAVKEQSDYRGPGRLRMPHGPIIAAGTLVFLLFSPR